MEHSLSEWSWNPRVWCWDWGCVTVMNLRHARDRTVTLKLAGKTGVLTLTGVHTGLSSMPPQLGMVFSASTAWNGLQCLHGLEGLQCCSSDGGPSPPNFPKLPRVALHMPVACVMLPASKASLRWA